MLVLCNYVIIFLIPLFCLEKRVGIYVMRVLGSGVYLGVEIDSFEIPTILQDIDKLIDGIQKVLTSKVRTHSIFTIILFCKGYKFTVMH